MKKLDLIVRVVVAIFVVGIIGSLIFVFAVYGQDVRIDSKRVVSAGNPGTSGLMKDGGSGGGGAPFLGGSSLYGIVWGPFLGPLFAGGPPGCTEFTVTKRIAKAIVDNTAKITFNAWAGDGIGKVRWKPIAGNYTYVTETGDDSTTHYVPLTGLPEDQALVLYSAIVYEDGCTPMTYPADTLMTTDCKGSHGTPATDAYYFMIGNNILAVTPDYKQKVRFKWEKTLPIPAGPYYSAWIGNFDTNGKFLTEVSLTDGTWTWAYKLSDACAKVDSTSWTAVGSFTVTGGEID